MKTTLFKLESVKMAKSIIHTFILTSLFVVFCVGEFVPAFSADIGTSVPAGRQEVNFNESWKFAKGEQSQAETPGYNDSGWIAVDLPHDYSIMDLPGDDNDVQIGPFSVESPGGRSTGYVLGGTGWYRKHFTLDEADAGKTVVLKFDGVYMESVVWVNGQKVGEHKYGYSPFWFDITSLLNPAGESNVIAVKVDNTGRNSRWYSGSGIYRNVHLVLTEPVHVSVWGTYITTPEITDDSATVNLAITVQNDDEESVDATVNISIINPEGQSVGQAASSISLGAEEQQIVNSWITVNNPSLWSIETPNLYQAQITIETAGRVVDTYTQSFGIRTVEFSVENGFLLNNKSILLKGGCMHHDNGLLGAAAFDRAEERRVEIMKANGFNAIRTAHNPPSEAFLNACDRLGMMVMDEFVDMWEQSKSPDDYSQFFAEWWKRDAEAMLLRDRNHPSIILWSIGNEVREKVNENGLRIGRELVDYFHEMDNTRMVTNAIDLFQYQWDENAEAMALLDVAGYNYQWIRYEEDHEKYPDRIMLGTESTAKEAFENWDQVIKNPYVVGDFVWTSWDYLGEVSLARSSYGTGRGGRGGMGVQRGGGIGTRGPVGAAPATSLMVYTVAATNAPTGGAAGARGARGNMDGQRGGGGFGGGVRSIISSWYGAWCGDIDITGEKKPQMYYRDILWDNNKLEINVHAPIPEGMTESVNRWGWPDEWPHWSWKGSEGKVLQVRVFTKADRVRLELNNRVIGEQNVSSETQYIASFDVPYEPGELKAIAYKDDIEIAAKSLTTAGDAAAIRLTADRSIIKADRNDISFVKIEAIDANGQVVPVDDITIKLTVTGNGELIASGNASPYDIESFNKPVIKTFKGRAQAIIRPYNQSGQIILRAESEGLKMNELVITSRSAN